MEAFLLSTPWDVFPVIRQEVCHGTGVVEYDENSRKSNFPIARKTFQSSQKEVLKYLTINI